MRRACGDGGPGAAAAVKLRLKAFSKGCAHAGHHTVTLPIAPASAQRNGSPSQTLSAEAGRLPHPLALHHNAQ